jgi:hypothetical protein
MPQRIYRTQRPILIPLPDITRPKQPLLLREDRIVFIQAREVEVAVRQAHG